MNNSKRGRKKLPKSEKVTVMTAYLKETEKALIKKKFGNLTIAAREAVLPKCG